MNTLKQLAGSLGTLRTEQYQGREHLVVPVIALVEGVVHAMNAPAPELVRAETLAKAPLGWNGRPVFFGHPMKGGRPVSGNSPDLLDTDAIGTIFNAALKGTKLTMEAWVDVLKADADLLKRLKSDTVSVEVSVGCFADTDYAAKGEFNGKRFVGEWLEIVPDHLALLPAEDEGACSIAMGCGVRAAQKGKAMPEEKKPAGLLARLLGALRGAQTPEEMSDRDLRKALYEALQEAEKGSVDIEAFLPITSPDRVVYSVWNPMPGPGYPASELWQRAFTLAANGDVILDPNKVEVEPVLTYEPVLMDEAPEVTVAAGARHSAKDQAMVQAMHDHATALGANCSGTSATTEKNMKRCELTKFLETATDAQLAALSAVVEGKQVEDPKPAEQPKAAEAAKPQTFEEVLATAAPEIRESIAEGLRVSQAKKTASIKTLKDSGRCDLTDEQLSALPQGELDKLVKLAGIRAAVDFSGLGAPRADQDTSKDAPAAPDLNARILAAKK